MPANRSDLFTISPLKIGTGHVVVYSPSGGPKEQIGDFASEIAAVNWITISSDDWLKRRKAKWSHG
jgi:hypothetical protein